MLHSFNIFTQEMFAGYSTYTCVSHGGVPATNVWSEKNLDGVGCSQHLVLVSCCPWFFLDLDPPDVKVYPNL